MVIGQLRTAWKGVMYPNKKYESCQKKKDRSERIKPARHVCTHLAGSLFVGFGESS
jgi:hypothetical protein